MRIYAFIISKQKVVYLHNTNFDTGRMTLDAIILECIADNGENTLHKYIWYLQWAQQALREWDMDMPMDVKTIRLSTNGRMEANVPQDTLRVLRVGVLESDGNIWPMLQSQGAILATGINGGQKPFCRYYDGYGYNSLPVVEYDPNTVRGRWYYDEACGVLRMSGANVNIFYVEVAKRRFGGDCDAVIPDQMITLVKKYVRYMEQLKKDRMKGVGNSNAAQSLYLEYDRDRLNAFARMRPLDIESLRDASRIATAGVLC